MGEIGIVTDSVTLSIFSKPYIRAISSIKSSSILISNRYEGAVIFQESFSMFIANPSFLNILSTSDLGIFLPRILYKRDCLNLIDFDFGKYFLFLMSSIGPALPPVIDSKS